MNTTEFRTLIHEAFEDHTIFNGRDWHSVNELLFLLQDDERFKDFKFNVSVETDKHWTCIPALDCFVPNKIRAVTFYDDEIEYEQDEFNGTYFHNITIHDNR